MTVTEAKKLVEQSEQIAQEIKDVADHLAINSGARTRVVGVGADEDQDKFSVTFTTTVYSTVQFSRTDLVGMTERTRRDLIRGELEVAIQQMKKARA
jgi:hypothetical protein